MLKKKGEGLAQKLKKPRYVKVVEKTHTNILNRYPVGFLLLPVGFTLFEVFQIQI